MSKAIVVATFNDRYHWLHDCLASLKDYHRYPIITVNEPFELGVIRWIYEHTDLDEFLLLQDSVVVKQTGWLDEVFDHPGSVSLSTKQFFMYLGKYTREDLSKVELPEVKTKQEAIHYEDRWTELYAKADNVKYMWPLHDSYVFEEHHERNNMILENDFIKKYKGTWNLNML